VIQLPLDRNVTPGKLHRELVTILGDAFEGVTTGPDGITIHGDIPENKKGAVISAIERHIPDSPTTSKSIEERVSELEQLVQQLLNKGVKP
jgi:hypothetical protein